MDHVESVENSAGREAVEEFWEKAVESKCEGLMIKVRVRRPSFGASPIILNLFWQLLDDTEVGGDVDTGTDAPLADPCEDADEFANPAKTRRKGDANGSYSKNRKKPLPATYEPGT